MSLLTFFSVTFAVTWACFFGAALLAAPSTVPTGSPLVYLVFLFGVFAPALVALGMTAMSGGRAAVEALLRRVIQPVAPRWYIFAATYMVAIKLSAALLHRLIRGEWPAFGTTPWFVMAAAILLSMWVQAGEEIGWRAYALPRLAERLGLPAASILLGLIWASWHLPLFFIFPGADTYHQSFPLYLSQVTAISVAMAWLYWRAGGVLLPVMVMHAAVNNTKDIVPSATPGATNPFALSASLVGWLTASLAWAVAVYCLVRMRHAVLPSSVLRGLNERGAGVS